MLLRHKNKTLALLLAVLLGGAGLHCLYLRGIRDRWFILHLASLPVCMFTAAVWPDLNGYYKLLPWLLSSLIAQLEGVVLVLLPDASWDAKFNGNLGLHSDSGWPLAALLIATLMIGAGGLIFVIARLVDLQYTAGTYG